MCVCVCVCVCIHLYSCVCANAAAWVWAWWEGGRGGGGRYDDAFQYQNVFAPLVAMEAKYDQHVKEAQARPTAPLTLLDTETDT
jgi:hypothetical protein